jgi:DNA-binding beta-propeller fold protein YncE
MFNAKKRGIVLTSILLFTMWITISSSCLLFSDLCLAAQESTVLEVVTTITLDKEPFCIAVNEETNRVYVGVDRGLIVLDGETDEVVEEIPMEMDEVVEETFGDVVFAIDVLAINPQTNRMFASWGGQVSVFDGVTNKEVGEIPCLGADELTSPEESYAFALNPTTNLVYIADRTIYKDRYDRVLVYDAETGELVTSVNIPGSNEILYEEYVGVAVNSETNRVYVTYSVMASIYVIDGNTHKIIKSRENCFSIPYGDQMVDTLINPNTNIIYFIGHREKIDGETLESIGESYQGYLRAVDTQNNLLYTTSSEELYVLDGTTHERLASLELGWSVSMHEVAVNSKTDKVYLVNRSDKEISVVQRTLTFPDESDGSEVSQNWYLGVIVFAVVAAFLIALFLYIIKKRAHT